MQQRGEESVWVEWLESRSPAWANVAAIALAVASTGRLFEDEPFAIFGFAVSAAAAYALITLRRDQRLVDLALVLAPSLAIARSGVDGLGLPNPFAPFSAQDPGQSALLALRAGLFLLAVIKAPPVSWARTGALLALAAMTVASLAARGFMLFVVIGAVWVIQSRPRRPASNPARWGVALLLASAFVGMLPWQLSRADTPPSGNPAAMVAYWRGRRNLFRARVVALEWAKSEAVPNGGHLALADLVWELGHRSRARKVLEKVIAHPASEDVRHQAEDRLRRWDSP